MLSYLQISIFTEKKKQLRRKTTAEAELHQGINAKPTYYAWARDERSSYKHVERHIASLDKLLLLHTRMQCAGAAYLSRYHWLR